MAYVGVSNWKRVLALVVDLAVVNLIITKPLSNLIDKAVLKDMVSLKEVFSVLTINNLFFVSLLMGLLGVAYWSILEYKIGQTLGAVIFSLRAKSEEGGKRLVFSQAVLRNITKISMVFLIVDSVYVLFSPKKQRFFERLSKTRTVEMGKEKEKGVERE